MSSNDLVVRDTRDGNARTKIRFESPSPNSIASPAAKIVTTSTDGKLFAVAGASGLRVWELASRKHLYFLISPDEKLEHCVVSAIDFSPDSRLIAAIETDGLHLWEIATGQHLLKVAHADWTVRSVKFSMDGRFIALGTGNGDVLIYEVAKETPAAEFKGHCGAVGSLAFLPDRRRLASGAADTTILTWDLRELVSRPLAEHKLTAKELETAWGELDSSDASKAFAAAGRLARGGRQTVAFVAKRVPAAPRPDADQVNRLIQDLGSGLFGVREAAAKEIERLGEPALPALRKALSEKVSLETRRRMEGLIAGLDTGFLPPSNLLRPLRAIAVMERMGTPEAQKLLQTIGEGTLESRMTREAQVSLARLKRLSAGSQ